MLAAFASGTLTCVIEIRPPPGTRLNTSTRVESRSPFFQFDPRQDCTIRRFGTIARFRPRRCPVCYVAWRVPPYATLGPIFQQVVIDLSTTTYQDVVSPFGWAIKSEGHPDPIDLYIDDLRWE